MSQIKSFLALFIPPILLSFIRKAKPNTPAFLEYECVGYEWPNNSSKYRGWNSKDILNIYNRKWPVFTRFLQNTGPLGIDHEDLELSCENLWAHNIIMSYAYVLALSIGRNKTVSILDWGGGIGHYYLIAKTLYPNISFSYTVVDNPEMICSGRKILPKIHFFLNQSLGKTSYDLVFASGSLYYVKNWKEQFKKLVSVSNKYVFITRLQIIRNNPSFVFVQRPYNNGYNTEYLGWCINKNEFLSYANSLGLKLVREFIVQDRPVVVGAPEQQEGKGFLFIKNRT
jgi:putative methyltransferase (TIGR04325 family)